MKEVTTVKFKPLSQKEIEVIHRRGKITPEEKVTEWEKLGLCAPGDMIGSAAWRCHKFKNCHECLTDYANTFDEWDPFRFVVSEHLSNLLKTSTTVKNQNLDNINDDNMHRTLTLNRRNKK